MFSAFIYSDLNLFSKLFMTCFFQILYSECCYIHRRKALVIFKPLDNVCVIVLFSIVSASALLYFAKLWHFQNYFKPVYNDCYLLLFQKQLFVDQKNFFSFVYFFISSWWLWARNFDFIELFTIVFNLLFFNTI